MSGKRPVNPCTVKRKCMMCKDVDLGDRPTMCKALACEFYIPCSKCGMNADGIDPDIGWCENEHCKHINNIMEVVAVEVIDGHEIRAYDTGPNETEDVLSSVVSTGKKRRKITRPGVPPDELEDYEREYYLHRWEEYEGYYRDPVAYVTCHYLILEEIKLSYIMAEVLQKRGEALADKETEKSHVYSSIRKLKEQLPEKESERLSDDQVALGMIYDKYCEVNKKTRSSEVIRVLTPEAVALAPTLPFKLDPERMLRLCGFSLVEAQDAAQRVFNANEIEMSGLSILEFLGFKVKEKYAMPFDSDMHDINADEHKDTDEGLEPNG